MSITTPHLFGRLSVEQQREVKSSSAFFRGTEDFVLQNVHKNVGTLIQRLQASEQFQEDVADLMPMADYEAACDENDIEIVNGGSEVFYFNWDNLQSIESDADGGMIDWRAFCAAHELDPSAFAWDTNLDEIVPANAMELFEKNPEADPDDIPALAQGDALAGYVDASRPDGEDMVNFLADLARAAGNLSLAGDLDKQSAKNMKKMFENFINKDYISSQSNSSVADAQQNACEEYRLSTDLREIYEYHIVDRYFADAVAEHGEVVADVMDMTIWGRSCTGQSAALDYAVQQAFIDSSPYNLDDVVRKVMPEVAAALDAQIEAERKAEREISSPTLG